MNKPKKTKKPYAVKPTIYAACIEITNRNPTAGGLLCQMMIKSESGTLRNQDGEDGWLAITAKQWLILTGFSRHQYDNALKKLKKMGLIEFGRRKLSWTDPAAITWVKVSEEAISQIAEILERERVSAFGETTSGIISEQTENPTAITYQNTDMAEHTISEDAEPLIKNEITKNEIVINENTSNDIVAKPKLKLSAFSSKKGFIGKEGNEANWFMSQMRIIYFYSGHSPEPYSPKRLAEYMEMIDYLNFNPLNFHDYCSKDEDPNLYAIKLAIEGWYEFTQYAVRNYGSYNVPPKPDLWAVKQQIKVIPDFLKLVYFSNLITKRCASGDCKPPDFHKVAEEYSKSYRMCTRQEMEDRVAEMSPDHFLTSAQKSMAAIKLSI